MSFRYFLVTKAVFLLELEQAGSVRIADIKLWRSSAEHENYWPLQTKKVCVHCYSHCCVAGKRL